MIQKFWLKSSAFLTQQQTSILSAAFVIMGMSLLSKVFGLIKLRLLVHYFGDGDVTAIFLAANNLPELLFDTLILAVLSTSFIPVYTTFFTKENDKKASDLASSVMNITLIAYCVVALIGFIFTKQIAFMMGYGLVMSPDHVVIPGNLNLLVSLIRFMLVAQFFFIISGYLTAILQSHQRFLVPAVAATLYNIAMVLGIMFFAPSTGIYSTVIGILIGAFIQFAIQVPFIRSTGFIYSFAHSFKLEGVTKVFSLSVPRIIGATSGALVENLHKALSSLKGALVYVSMDYASRVAIVPVSLFGAAIAQAALPALTIAWTKNQKDQFLKVFISSFNQILFFTLPISSVLIVLRLPIVRLLFGDPRFTWEATVTTGRLLAILGVGVIGQSLIMLLARTFYAMHDTKTPLKVSLFTLALDAILASYAMIVLKLPILWLGAIFSFTTLLNTAILFIVLLRRVSDVPIRYVMYSPIKLIICSLAMTLMMYIPLRFMDLYVWEHVHKVGPWALPSSLQLLILDTRYTINLIILTIIASSWGIFTYFVVALFLQVEEMNIVKDALKKIRKVKPVLSQSSEIIEGEHKLT